MLNFNANQSMCLCTFILCDSLVIFNLKYVNPKQSSPGSGRLIYITSSLEICVHSVCLYFLLGLSCVLITFMI